VAVKKSSKCTLVVQHKRKGKRKEEGKKNEEEKKKGKKKLYVFVPMTT
jgi:hypothetical protein